MAVDQCLIQPPSAGYGSLKDDLLLDIGQGSSQLPLPGNHLDL